MHRPVRRSPSGTPASARAMWDALVLAAQVVPGGAVVLAARAVRVMRKGHLAVLARWQLAGPVVLEQPKAVPVALARPRAVPVVPVQLRAVPLVELLLSPQ